MTQISFLYEIKNHEVEEDLRRVDDEVKVTVSCGSPGLALPHETITAARNTVKPATVGKVSVETRNAPDVNAYISQVRSKPRERRYEVLSQNSLCRLHKLVEGALECTQVARRMSGQNRASPEPAEWMKSTKILKSSPPVQP